MRSVVQYQLEGAPAYYLTEKGEEEQREQQIISHRSLPIYRQ